MKKFYLFATSLVLVLSSCSNNSNNADVEIPEGNIKPLSLLVDIETPITRSSSVSDVSGEVNTDNLSQIGVHICEHENFGTAYIGGSHNTTWTKSGNNWATTTPVYLGSKNANVYAYHPYSNSADLNVVAIPVAVGNTDYLFGKAEKDNAIFVANNQNTTASIKMKHAMSQIIWNFTKEDTYTGAAQITAIAMSKLNAAGTLNIQTGEIAKTGEGNAYTLNVNLTAPTSKNLMVFPTAYAAEDAFAMSFTIDGKTMTSTFDKGFSFSRGMKHNINVKLKGTGIVIESVTVEPWGDGADQNLEIN
ncbi:MAG: fimbrillin family protein [Tannerellaceae bacterium]